MTCHPKDVIFIIGCLALALQIAGCGSGGSGSEAPSSSPPLSVSLQGVTHAGASDLPLAQAQCRLINQQDGQLLAQNSADTRGAFALPAPLERQGWLQCHPPSLPRLMLSTFVSTVGQPAGTTLTHEDVTPATTVIADIIAATNPSDPQRLKAQLLAELAMGEPTLTLLVEVATEAYSTMLEAQLQSEVAFAGEGQEVSDEGEDSGDADAGGAEGEAGDGGEFSPIAGAACEFSLDRHGLVRANTVLGDLFADGRMDRLDLLPIAATVNRAIDPARRRAITEAFAAWFPAGLGQPIRTVAADANAAAPGRYFMPTPPNVPGVIRCRPPDQASLILSTCLRARAPHEILVGEDVTPGTSVICDLITEAEQASLEADRENTKRNLLANTAPLRIFLSEDRNGNGVQDAGERDKNSDGVLSTTVEIETAVPLSDDNRDLALLVAIATTIFDTMRLERMALTADRSFEEAREDFFTDGAFNEAFTPLETGVESVLENEDNQAVLETDDVVTAARTGTLRGTVADESGVPLSDVRIIVLQNDIEVDVEGNPAITNTDGSFNIAKLPTGDVTVTAFKNGFEPLRITTTIVPIVTVERLLTLAPDIDGEGDDDSEEDDHSCTGRVTLANGFRITCQGVTFQSDASTWRYRVEELSGAQDLGNWVLALPGCARVVSATPRPWEVVHPDPNAGLDGIKWEVGAGFRSGDFSVTLDGNVFVGVTQVAAKGPDVAQGSIAGPQCQ